MKARLWLLCKIAALFAAAGLLAAPLDASIQKDRKELKFGGKPISVDLRQQMGQGMAIAFLGGFRAIAADYLWVAMHTEWENYHWARIPPLLNAVTSLQPQCYTFWDVGGWHLAYNLYSACKMAPLEPGETPEARNRKCWRWVELGEQFWMEGTKNMPNDATLFASLARLYEDPWKFDDPCKGAESWKLALGKDNCPSYAHRAVGYSLRRCAEKTGEPSKFRAAFNWWRDTWLKPRDNPREMWSAVRREMRVVRQLTQHFGQLSSEEDQKLAQQEIALGVQPAERIFARDETSMSQSDLRELFNVWTNEWLRPHNDVPALWEFVRNKLVLLKERVTLTAQQEDWMAHQEEQFKIPFSQRVFKSTEPHPES